MRTAYPVPRPGVGPPAPNRPRVYITQSGVPHRAFPGGAGTAIAGAAGAVNQLTGAFTLAAVIRRTTTGAEIAMAHTTAGFGVVMNMGVNSTSALRLETSGAIALTPTLTLTIADGWAIIAFTKAATTVTPRAHLYKGGSWTHEAMSTTVPDAATHVGGYMLFASSIAANYAVDVAVGAEWDSVLSDGDIETFDWASQNWADLSPLSLWNFDQAVRTDPIPDLIGANDLNGDADAPISYDGPRDWDFSVTTVHERSASLEATAEIASSGTFYSVESRAAALSATAAITSAGLHIAERSAALSATAAIVSAPQRALLRSAALTATAEITSSGNVTAIFERSASISASASIASTPQRELLRSAALSATGDIASSALFFSILERTAAISATSEIATAGQRALLRAAELSATAQITTSGVVEGGVQTHERSAAITATASVETAGQRDLLRAASIDATGTITTAPQRALSRSASLSAIAEIASNGEIQGAVTRSASFTASATISTSPQRALSRSAALAAVAAIAGTPQRELHRSAAFSASAGIATNGNVAHVFAGVASLSAVADIASTGQVALVFERSAALTALAEIITAEGDVGQFRWANSTDNEWITVPDP
jgi:hypothetical protein